jgi:glycosyltransferase involved in cell wall biosynthesis
LYGTMKYVFVSYNYSPDFDSPESWFKRTEGYAGVMECLSRNNTVINVKQINYEGYYLYKGVHYHFVNFARKKNYFPHQLNQFVKSLVPDVVVVQGLHHPLQVIQLKTILPKRTKLIAQHHAEKPFTGIKKHVQRIADKCIDACLFASNDMGLEWVKSGNITSAKKIHEVMEVSSNFYPINKITAKAQLGICADIVFLWVGRLNENKDPLNVVKAFLEYAETNASARLYMIYHTDELLTKVKKIIESHLNKSAITLIGKVSHHDILNWYNSADFFISGSHYEGSGTAVCEAMSCGCIPIVTDILSFRMITNQGNCGILYKPGNESELLTALRSTATIDVAKKRNRSLTYFDRNLSFRAIATQIEKVAEGLF